MRAMFLVFPTCVVLSPFAIAQRIPCKDAKVLYEKLPAFVARNIKLSTYVNSAFSPSAKENSPQGTRWFVNIQPDYMKAGPWNTTLIIGNRADGKPFLTASFKDHGNTFFAKWLMKI